MQKGQMKPVRAHFPYMNPYYSLSLTTFALLKSNHSMPLLPLPTGTRVLVVPYQSLPVGGCRTWIQSLLASALIVCSSVDYGMVLDQQGF